MKSDIIIPTSITAQEAQLEERKCRGETLIDFTSVSTAPVSLGREFFSDEDLGLTRHSLYFPLPRVSSFFLKRPSIIDMNNDKVMPTGGTEIARWRRSVCRKARFNGFSFAHCTLLALSMNDHSFWKWIFMPRPRSDRFRYQETEDSRFGRIVRATTARFTIITSNWFANYIIELITFYYKLKM